jgi:membrane-associated protein
MDAIFEFIKLLIHDMPLALEGLSNGMGAWFYVVLFLIVFAETGLIVTPFLPGDSLLFAAGAVCALPGANLSVWLLGVLLFAAALLGDTVNYNVARWATKRFVSTGSIPFVKPEHLKKTNEFFVKHGGKTIFMARFLPIVRTYAPFVAGASGMVRSRFYSYSVFGAFTWITLFLGLGFVFGNQPVIRANFKYVILAIIVISVAPAMIEFIRSRRASVSTVP